MNLIESFGGNPTEYYNVRMEGGGGSNIADFSEERVRPVLDNPAHYELAVARFSVPAQKLPIMFFRDGDPANGYGEHDLYTITMSFDGVDVTKTLVHLQTEFPTNLYNRPTVWSYNDFLSSMNDAYAEAFAELKALKPLAPPTAPPFMVFNQATERFSFYAPEEYITGATPTIEIFFNNVLSRLFDTFQTVYHGDNPREKRWHYWVRDNHTNRTIYNGQNYLIMHQDGSTLYLWNEIQSIQFLTSSIPVNPEFESAQRNVTRKVLTDFEPLSGSPGRDVIQYFPQGPLRWYGLNSNYPLRAIDLHVRWIDREGNSWPIYVSTIDPLTVKLQFRKKKFADAADAIDLELHERLNLEQ